MITGIAYLRGREAEGEQEQNSANQSALAVYAYYAVLLFRTKRSGARVQAFSAEAVADGTITDSLHEDRIILRLLHDPHSGQSDATSLGADL